MIYKRVQLVYLLTYKIAQRYELWGKIQNRILKGNILSFLFIFERKYLTTKTKNI